MKKALEVFTAHESPKTWSSTHAELGRVYVSLADGASAARHLTAIVESSIVKDQCPDTWTTAWVGLRNAYIIGVEDICKGYPLGTCMEDVREKAIECYTGYTRYRTWA